MQHALPVFDSPFASSRDAAGMSSPNCGCGQGPQHLHHQRRPAHRLRHLVNHQSCEPVKHQERFAYITGLGPRATPLRLRRARPRARDHRRHGAPPPRAVLGIATHTHGELSITAIVTGGVTGNAGSAGDTACYDEADGKWGPHRPCRRRQQAARHPSATLTHY
jgi:hypothetical protein